MVLRDCSCLSRHLYRGHHSCGNNRKNPSRELVVPFSIQRGNPPTPNDSRPQRENAGRLTTQTERPTRRKVKSQNGWRISAASVRQRHAKQKGFVKPAHRLSRNRLWSGVTTSTVRYMSFDRNRLAGERACTRRISASDAFTAAKPCSIISRS